MSLPTVEYATGHHDARPAMPWARARELAHRLPVPLASEQIPLSAAAGRTLAEPLRAATMLPSCDNAAMDGYAVAGAGPWRLVGRALAGHPTQVVLADGGAVEIGTGAVVPPGTDRVVPYEAAERAGDTVNAPPAGRTHIRRAGEYVSLGQQLLGAGHVLNAPSLGLAASIGIDVIAAAKRPVVHVLVTGDELVTAGVPKPGQVRDAISPMLEPLLTSWGAHRLATRRVPDIPADCLTTAVETCLADADVLLVCGSSSVGPTDNLHATLAGLDATVHIDGVDCRPGHPQSLAQLGNRWLLGVPGNPYAALAAAFTILQPLLAALLGQPMPRLSAAALSGPIDTNGSATRLIPVRWHSPRAQPIQGACPAHLGAAATADAIAVVPPTWLPGYPADIIAMP